MFRFAQFVMKCLHRYHYTDISLRFNDNILTSVNHLFQSKWGEDLGIHFLDRTEVCPGRLEDKDPSMVEWRFV